MDQVRFSTNEICCLAMGNETIIPQHKCALLYTTAPIKELPPNITHVVCHVNCRIDFLSKHVKFLCLNEQYTWQLCDKLENTFLTTLVVKNESVLKNASIPQTLTSLWVDKQAIDIAEFRKINSRIPENPDTPKIPAIPKMIDHTGKLYDVFAKRYDLLCDSSLPYPATKYSLYHGTIRYIVRNANGINGLEYPSIGTHLIEDLLDEHDRSKVMGWMCSDGNFIASLKY